MKTGRGEGGLADELKAKRADRARAPEFSFEAFEQQYGAQIQQKVADSKNYDCLVDGNITREKVNQVMFERELAFCRQMIERLNECRAMAGQNLPPGEPMAIQFNTSMLYDVDETVGTFSRRHGFGWQIRPCITYLFKFLTEQSINIGLCTTRGEQEVEKQLGSKDASYSLAEIASFISGQVKALPKGSESPFPLVGAVTLDFGYLGTPGLEIVPGMKVYKNNEELWLEQSGWSREKLMQLVNEVGPILYEKEIELMIKDRRTSGDDYNIEEVERLSKNNLTEYKAEVYSDLKLLSFGLEVSALMEKNFTDPSIPELSEIFRVYKKFRRIRHKVSESNKKSYVDFKRRIEELLGFDIGQTHLLYRLVMSKQVLDETGAPYLVITVDDDAKAEKLYELFTGKIKDKKGKPVDGYKVFNLQQYRNRLFIISCGARGAYDISEVIEDLQAA